MSDNEIREKQITDLITECCNLIESKYPYYFYYDVINLRGVVERECYGIGLGELSGLLPLFRTAISVAGTTETLSSLAKKVGLQKQKLGLLFFRSYLSGWITGLRMILGWIPYVIHSRGERQVSYIFCALFGRFAWGFEDVINKLGRDQCAFLPVDSLDVSPVARRMEVNMLKSCGVCINPLKIRMSVTVPIFGSYMRAVRQYLSSRAVFIKHRPEVTIFAEGTSMKEEATALAARSLGIPSVRIQSGRAGVLHTGYQRMSYSRMLVWGEGFVERMRTTSPDPAYIVTGNPQLDAMPQTGFDPSVELFRSGHNLLAVFTQPVSLHISGKNLYISENSYQELVKIVQEVLNQKTSLRVVVRKHPADTCLYFENLTREYADRLCVTSPEDYSLASILESSTIAIGFYSTTLSEAAACGVVPVMFDGVGHGEVFPYPGKAGAAVCVDCANMAVREVIRLLENDEYRNSYSKAMELFTSKYFGCLDGKSLVRVVDGIQSAAK